MGSGIKFEKETLVLWYKCLKKTELTMLNLYFGQRLGYLAKGCGWRDEWTELGRVWLQRGD